MKRTTKMKLKLKVPPAMSDRRESQITQTLGKPCSVKKEPLSASVGGCWREKWKVVVAFRSPFSRQHDLCAFFFFRAKKKKTLGLRSSQLSDISQAPFPPCLSQHALSWVKEENEHQEHTWSLPSQLSSHFTMPCFPSPPHHEGTRKISNRRKEKEPLSPSFTLIDLWFCVNVQPCGKAIIWCSRWWSCSEVSSLLVDHPGVNVNWTNPDTTQRTPLHIASRKGPVEVVKLLLAHPNILVNLKDGNGQTPFHLIVGLAKCLLFECRWRILVSISFLKKTTAALYCGGCLVGDDVKWLSASLRVAEIWGTSRTREGDTGMANGKSLLLLKWQESTTRLKLCRCLKDSWPTQHKSGMNFVWSLDCRMRWLLRSLPWQFFCAMNFFNSSQPLTLLLVPLPLASLSSPPSCPWSCRWCSVIVVVGSMKQNILKKDSEAVFTSLAKVLLLDSQSE